MQDSRLDRRSPAGLPAFLGIPSEPPADRNLQAAPPARATPEGRCGPLHTAGSRGVGRPGKLAALTGARLALQPGREGRTGEGRRRE